MLFFFHRRYRLWIDEVSQLFGGLDICALEIVQSKDGKEYIVQVNDCCMQLLGETQDEDRRCIAELVMHKMQIYCRPDKQQTIMPYDKHCVLFLISFYFQSDSRVPSVEQNITELPKLTKAPSPISDSTSTSTLNMQNTNRRELPNVPKPTTPNENRPSTSQNPFYNPPTATNASTSRPSPSQWMGNISQTIRRQTTNAADV